MMLKFYLVAMIIYYFWFGNKYFYSHGSICLYHLQYLGYFIINFIFIYFNNKVFFMNIQEGALRMEIKKKYQILNMNSPFIKFYTC